MKRFIFILSCIIACSEVTMAQESDFGLWTFVGVDKKISNRVSVYGEAELRTRDDVKTIDCWSLYAEVSAKILPFLRGGGGYTYIDYNHPTLSWESRHRLNLFLSGSYSYRNWNFALRERYEQVHRILTDKSASTPYPKRTLRSRFQCIYQIPETIFSPYATIELYTLLNNSAGVKNEKIRYTIGMQILAYKHLSVSIYYRYIDMMDRAATQSNILGIGCRFRL